MKLDTTPNSFTPGLAELDKGIERRVSQRNRLMGPAYRLSYANPLHFVRGEGIWLFDQDDKPYLDFYNNVASLGHCHPRVVEALSNQASILATNTRYIHDGIIDYSERLLELFPSALSHAMFTCSGSEANDLACRVAKSYTGGEGFIISDFAYHGTTSLIAGLSANLGPSMPLSPNVRTVPAPIDRNDENIAHTFTANVRAAIADLTRHGIKPAALIVDSIFSSDGVCTDPPGFLAGAVKAIRQHGGIFIADEVQPGFARTGDTMWGFERHKVVPDIVTLGKPMGNGYPMSGMIVRPEIIQDFGANARYFNTFGGNTVAAANGLAVLDVIHDEQLLTNSKNTGHYLKKRLTDLSDERIAEVRGAGLFLGVEIVEGADAKTPCPATAAKIVNELREQRVLISLTGKYENVLKIRPPLISKPEDVDYFIGVLERVIKKI